MEEYCDHPLDLRGLCVVCGKDLTRNSDNVGLERALFLHNNLSIRVSKEEAQRLHYESVQELLGARKLSLVLDLDQTVLHATIDPQVEMWLNDPSHEYHELARTELYRIETQHGPHYIKLRPGVRDFLERMSSRFELHVYTMGNREYAESISRLLDPEGKLFGERIVSRDDNLVADRKSLKRIFPHDDKTALVVDDRGDVWSWCENLIPIAPFIFFVSKRQKANSEDPDYTYIEERISNLRLEDLDRGLEEVAMRLEFVHSQFFDDQSISNLLERDVKPIVTEMRTAVLSGYDMCFSGMDHNTPQARSMEQMAESFGAVVHQTLPSQYTEGWILVSSNTQSVKSIEARGMGIPVVTPQWLWDSVYSWRAQLIDVYIVPSTEETASLVRTSSFTSIDALLLEEIDKEFEEISDESSSHKSDEQEQKRRKLLNSTEDYSEEDYDSFIEEIENDLI